MLIPLALGPLTILSAHAAEWPTDRLSGGFVIDTADRFLVRSFYEVVHEASVGTPIGWSGAVATCDPGSTAVGFQRAVLARVNYHRAMAGVPASVTFRPEFNDKAQQAALLMSANNALDHTPPSTWTCWTAVGAEAAGYSNLSLGINGWDAVNGQMLDNGANNFAVGHRRWLLNPQIEEMGTGDIPATGAISPANAIWHNDSHLFDPRPGTREAYVAWPPPGFVPYQIVPARWSFSYSGADFTASTVTVTENGESVPVLLEATYPLPGSGSFIGEATLAWVVDGLDANAFNTTWPHPAGDTSYEVSVDNVLIDGESRSFNYQVTVIDPAEPGLAEAVPIISGPAAAPPFGTTSYQIAAVPHAVSYELRTLDLLPYSTVAGAEAGLTGITDDTGASYPLISDAIFASGSHAFHLAHTPAPPPAHSFTLSDRFLLGSAARLLFKSRMTTATEYQVASAQLSVDEGITWIDLYSQAGAGDPGESTFSQRDLSLADYAGEIAMIRFVYDIPPQPSSVSYYPQTQDGVGFYVDDIELLDVQRVAADSLTDLGADNTFDFIPGSVGAYALQARPYLWQGYPPLDWGPITTVTTLDDGADVDISADQQAGYAGQSVAFSIGYNNTGASMLTGVVVTIDRSPALNFVDSTLLPDRGDEDRWTLPDLAAGASGLIEVTLSLPDNAVDGAEYQIDAVLNADQASATDSVTVAVDNALRDTDSDGDPDITDPDDDNDGMGDLWETDNSFDPLDATDADGDTDKDGLTNRDEHDAGTNPRRDDSDGDGHLDGADVDPLDRMRPIPMEALPSWGGWRAILTSP